MKAILGTSKAKEFREFLRDQIRQGKYKAGEKIPTVREFAEKYSLNKTTVNSAVLNLAAEGLLVSYAGKGTFVTRPRKKQGPKLIGYIFDAGISREYPSVAFHIRNLTRELSGSNYSLVADEYPADGGMCGNPEFQKKVKDGFFAGLIAYTPLSLEDLVFLRKQNMPVVIVGDEANDAQTASVCADMFEAGMMLTEHLVKLGHKKIALLTGPEGNRAGELVGLGYRAVMAKYELNSGGLKAVRKRRPACPPMPEPGSDRPGSAAREVDVHLQRYPRPGGPGAPRTAVAGRPNLFSSASCLIPGPWGEASGQKLAEQILDLKEKPTAIIAAEEIMALGLMRKILERGCRIPDDFAIAAMGDRLPVSTYPVPLTVSDTDEEAQIVKAAGLLLDLIQGKEVNRKMKLPPKLIVRQSSGGISEV